MRDQITSIVEAIPPWDPRETRDRSFVLDWIASGADLFRREKPATPPTHLVAYMPVIDGDHILLVDHINAELWLPTGGHVDPDEHPRDTAARELREELNLEAVFLTPDPIFVTVETTRAKTGGHQDVTLWYPVRGDRRRLYDYDAQEFLGIRWFHFEDLPTDRMDPNLSRFIAKMAARAA